MKEIKRILQWLPSLTEENSIDYFKNDYKNWVLNSALAYDHPHLLVSTVKLLVENGLFLLQNTPLEEISYKRYALHVKAEINYYLVTEIPEELILKAQMYVHWLEEHKQYFDKLDNLIAFRHNKKNYRDIHAMIKLLPGQSIMVDPEKLNTDLIALWQSADEKVIKRWLQFEESDQKKNIWFSFDFNYYLNPLAYEQFPEHKPYYYKLLIAYLSDELFKRKNLLNPNPLTAEYFCIEGYVVWMQGQLRKLTIPAKKKRATVVPQPIVSTDYPKHIFLNEKAYLVFEKWMDSAQKVADVSFIFRAMSEKDKPALIMVRDVSFRDWYNDQDYKILLPNTTTVYYKCENESRKALYSSIKCLIMSN